MIDQRTLARFEFPKVCEHLARLASSEPGVRFCSAVVPLEDASARRERLDLVVEAVEYLGQGEATGTPVADFPAVDAVLDWAHTSTHGHLDLDDLYALRAVLHQGQRVREAVQGDVEDVSLARYPGLATRMSIPWPTKCASGFTRCLGDDGRLKDDSSPGLFSVRSEIRSIHRACRDRAGDFARDHGIGEFLQEEYLTISSDRYVLPVKTNFKGRVDGIIHHYSQTGETVYVEPAFLVDLNNKLAGLKNEERVEERKVLELLTGFVRSEAGSLQGIYKALVEMDLFFAAAGLAITTRGRCIVPTPVEFSGACGFDLRGARHPLLAMSGEVTPVDIALREQDRCLLISGGNAGGKTVSLKTLGLISLMTLAGLPVPVEEGSRITAWHDVHVFLGDEQSLEEHLSTFTAQIRGLADVWERTGPGTLVVLDEFGAGTDPAQGSALARAVIEELLGRGAHVAAATHFPALKTFGLTAEGVRSASVVFDPDTKRPLYTLAYDQVGASIALDVAAKHGLPASVLERAREHLLLEGGDTGDVLERLNRLAVERQDELTAMQRDRTRHKERADKLEQSLKQERERLAGEMRDVSRTILAEWRKGKVGQKQARKKLADSAKRVAGEGASVVESPVPSPPDFDPAALTPGDAVRYLPWGKKATLQEVDARKGRYKVDLNGVALWAKAEELGPVSDGGPASTGAGSSARSSVTVRTEGGRPTQVDVRGMRADVAEAELERAIDRAMLAGTEELEVVHGRGTGALRRTVHEACSRHPCVASCTLADEESGGDGMTRVLLR